MKIQHLVFALLFFFSATAQAGRLADLAIADETTGEVLQVYPHEGKLYVVGMPGHRYALRFVNKANRRVEAVMSVDGINVITGDTAGSAQSGYVFSAGQSTDIKGWRKSNQEVAAFYFTSVQNSYAGRTDRLDNTGVIAVAVFREYLPPPPPPSPVYAPRAYSEDSVAMESNRAESKKSMRGMQSDESHESAKLGTGHGERIDSQVTSTEFRRHRESPDEVIAIYYDSRDNLVRRGIVPKKPVRPKPNLSPNPFPGDNGFVPDPPHP